MASAEAWSYIASNPGNRWMKLQSPITLWHFPEWEVRARVRADGLHPGALGDCQTCGWLYR